MRFPGTVAVFFLGLIAAAAPSHPIDLRGLGPNGLRVDPYVQTAEAESACRSRLVARSAMRDLCGDDDGCEMRLVSDGTFERGSAKTGFVTDDDVVSWFVGDSYAEGTFGTNGDTFSTEVLTILHNPSTYCSLVDDLGADDAMHFVLLACAQAGIKISCTTRVDD